MGKNRKNQIFGYGVREQIVMSGKSRLLVESYLSPKGKMRLKMAKTKAEKDEIKAKYGKNRYKKNPDYRVFRDEVGKTRVIQHV